MTNVWTVGHSSLDLGKFLSIIRAAEINVIADVRSSPRSKRFPWFDQQELRSALKERGVKYVFLGDQLGGRPKSRSLYLRGVANYEAMSQTETFKAGLERVRSGAESFRVAMMCSERDPLECHRFLLISRELSSKGLNLLHLKHDGGCESHEEAERRLLREEGLGEEDLFVPLADRLASAYKKRSLSAAFSETGENPSKVA